MVPPKKTRGLVINWGLVMNFNIFGMSVKVQRSATKSDAIDMNVVGDINEITLGQVRGTSYEELERRVLDVSVQDVDTEQGIELATEVLKENGIVVVPRYLPSQVLSELNSDVDCLVDEYVGASASEVFEDDYVLFQKGSGKVGGYANLAKYPKTIMQVREGQDQGMIDIFNVNYRFPTSFGVLKNMLSADNVVRVIRGQGGRVHVGNLNCYINRGIGRTRGFHVDSYQRRLKAFVYLTDVESLDCGPYTYVRASHSSCCFRAINKAISEKLPYPTETPIVPQDSVIPILAKAGSLVISDQAGFHRGFPQAQGCSRKVAVMNFT